MSSSGQTVLGFDCGLKGKSWTDPAAITANILVFMPFFSLFLLVLPLKERGLVELIGSQ